MHDLPFQGRLQQAHARPVSGEELEAMGKAAAARWTNGNGNLTSAVVDQVKHAGLSPEQVCRVVEFANTSAYLNEFHKEGSPNKIIEFVGGPADPSEVLRDLNDGGGGTVFDRGLRDYNSPPSVKTSSVHEEAMYGLFGSQMSEVDPDPLREVVDVREKLATLLDHTTAQLSGLEVMAPELENRLYHQVKVAALEGLQLGEIIRAWETVTDEPEHMKLAFGMIAPRLMRDGVFESLDSLGASLEKTGSVRLVNEQHPLVDEFTSYLQLMSKMAELQAMRQDAEDNLQATDAFLSTEWEKLGGIKDVARGVKNFFVRRGGQAAEQAAHVAPQAAADRAIAAALERQAAKSGKNVAAQTAQAAPQVAPPSGGIVGGVTDFFRSAAEPVRSIGHGVGGALFGENSQLAKATGDVAGGLVQYAPHIAAGAGAYRLYQHGQSIAQSPLGQKMRSFVPGTPENMMVQQDLDNRYSGGVPYFPTGPYVNY